MRNDQRLWPLALCGLVMLAGCGGQDEKASGNGSASAETATKGATKSADGKSGWNAADAWTLLDKCAVGGALGSTVSETAVGLVDEWDGVTAATSECTYRLTDGQTLTLMARWSPIDDNSPEAMAATRKATEQAVKAFSSRPVEDIAGLGKSAFWVPGINQLSVFLDERRFVTLTLTGAPAEKAKDIATGLVGKIR